MASTSSTYRIHWALIVLFIGLGIAGYWLWNKRISSMLDVHWNAELQAADFPWWGEYHGISLANLSPNTKIEDAANEAYLLRQEARFQNYLDKLPRQIDQQKESSSSSASIASLETLQWYLDFQLRAKPFLYHFFPLNSYTGNPWALNRELELTYPIHTGEDAEVFVSQIPVYIEQMKIVTSHIDSQAVLGTLPPQALIDRSIQSLNEMASLKPDAHPLYRFLARALVRLPATAINEDNAATLLMQMYTVLENQLYPTYRELASYLENIKTKAPLEGGATGLPDGVAYYQYCLEYYVGKDADPDVMVRLAERETKALNQILTQLSTSSETAPQTKTRIQVYEETLADMRKKTKGIFSYVPKRGPILKSRPLFWPDRGETSLYIPAKQISTGKAVVYMDIEAEDQASELSDIAQAYASTIPGSHLASSYLAEDDMRNLMYLPAWQEGWALYAASLPVTDLRLLVSRPEVYKGYVQMRLLYAAKVIADVKVHRLEWKRIEAIAYLSEIGRMSEEKASYEVDRILACPAAACAPLMGELKFHEIRARISEDLDQSISLKEFHDWILALGPIPFHLLDRYTDEWIQSKLAS